MKSALEKIVFFECRIDQLNADLAHATAEAVKLRADLAEAAARELAMRQELAASEARAGRAERDRDDALERATTARLERDRLLDRLVEAERIRQAGEAGEDIDLAAFISELRAEIITLRAAVADPAQAATLAGSSFALPTRPHAASPATAAARPQPSPAGPRLGGNYASAEEAAETLALEGRLGVSDADRDALRSGARFETRSDETLFALSLRELTSSDAAARVRAAQRLKNLGARAALPAIAAALNSETAPDAECALLEVMAAAGDPSMLPLIEPKLGSPLEAVRIAALEAAHRLRGPGCLLKAVSDPSPRVRRRAAVLAAGDPSARAVLEKAAADPDSSVRRVAVLGMADDGEGPPEEALLAKLDDLDPSVRRAAAKGLSRTFGPEVFAIVDLDSGRRRREIRRLAAEGARLTTAPSPASRTAPTAARTARSNPGSPPEPQLEEDIVGRVRAALRGRSADEIAREVGARAEVVTAATSALERRGRLVRRGQRYFVP